MSVNRLRRLLSIASSCAVILLSCCRSVKDCALVISLSCGQGAGNQLQSSCADATRGVAKTPENRQTVIIDRIFMLVGFYGNTPAPPLVRLADILLMTWP